MFASHVSDSQFPFNNDESFKTWDNGLCAPVQMLANTFQPVIENFATLFFALIYIPEVIVLIYLPIPLCRMLITNYDKMTSGI